MTGDQVKECMMKRVKPDVRVKALRKTKDGIVIETVNQKERQVLYDSKKYESAGLKVQLPRKVGPSVIVYDVPNGMSDNEMLRETYGRNLKECMSAEEFKERVRIVNRSGKRGAALGNVVIEVTMSACEKLISEGRVYVAWNAFRVKRYESVLRCYACYGYGHMGKECGVGRLCRAAFENVPRVT